MESDLRQKLDQILAERPHTNFVDIEEERIVKRFRYEVVQFYTRMLGVVFLEFDSSRVNSQDVAEIM